jgi:glycosyl transferase family 25
VTAILDRTRDAQTTAGDDAHAQAAWPRIYAINLARASNRWQRLSDQAVQFGLDVTRVPAVDGNKVAEHERVDFYPRRFDQHNGRRLLPGEYGCYRSHLLALEQFVATGDEIALIVEDDIDLNAQLIQRAIAALKAIPGAGLVKLANHRMVGFRPLAETSEKDVVGRCLHGPQGSAACYIVTRAAAEKLLVTLKPMLLPYDVALERGWATGVATYTTQENLVEFSPFRSETAIGKRSTYRAAKKHFLLRASAHWFRTHDQIRRWIYTVQVRPNVGRP